MRDARGENRCREREYMLFFTSFRTLTRHQPRFKVSEIDCDVKRLQPEIDRSQILILSHHRNNVTLAQGAKYLYFSKAVRD